MIVRAFCIQTIHFNPSKARFNVKDIDPRLAQKAKLASLSVFIDQGCDIRLSLNPRAAATRWTWYSAAATLMCGSSPLPEAVTRSTGIGSVLPGSAALSASMRAWTASRQRRVQRSIVRAGRTGQRIGIESVVGKVAGCRRDVPRNIWDHRTAGRSIPSHRFCR